MSETGTEGVVSSPEAAVEAAPQNTRSNTDKNSKAHRRGAAPDGFSVDNKPKDVKQETNKTNPDSKEETLEREDQPSVAETKKKFKVKVLDNDLEVDEDELIRGYSLSKASTKKFEEAARLKKEASQLIEALKDREKLFKYLPQLGHDPRALAEEYLHSVLTEETMDPKERLLAQREREIQEYKMREQKRIEMIKAKRLEEATKKQIDYYNNEFGRAISEVKGLPVNKETIQMMAKYIKKAATEGWELSPKEAALAVKDDLKQVSTSTLKDLDGDDLLNILGEDAVERLLKARGAKVKNPHENMGFYKPNEPKEPKKLDRHSTLVEWNRMKRIR